MSTATTPEDQPVTGTSDATSDVTSDTTPPVHRTGVRVGTVAWGLIVVLVGVGVLIVAAGYTIDVQLAAIVLLIAAGVALIVGPLVQGLRRGRAGER
ncbi:hypothetical protein [Cellulomonas phragmiteti]|uniref:Uncharacterized protein n=1 Tax=Cellulomonas phragmiteti TaxID=478780 RepID=A0ABQ4DIB3_9CELL|nr:hypothetical protein [Cellulomonas phragmiteti]GIG39085.1 hypothetical protein Cph01nite_08470 [Cellulomonas phragmiteti]